MVLLVRVMPYLNARIFANNVDKFARVFTTMVEPTATINHVIFLQDTKTRAHGRCMGEDENSPTIVGRTFFDGLFKPSQLPNDNKEVIEKRSRKLNTKRD